MHGNRKKAVIFGAGNIGRSFIGNIFASNGWRVIFVDANSELVDRLNNRGSYTILIKRNNRGDETVTVSGISALHSSQSGEIIEELCSCSLCATSVGQNALRFVVPQIAEAVKTRAASGQPPLDVIIAENIRNGADFFRGIFIEKGLDGSEAGLVETSIGKMVPTMLREDLAVDPLILHAEEYNTLILDAEGFKNPVPDLPEIKAVKNIAAWVDRKLFIHNLGHAAAAYFGYRKFPERHLIAEIITDNEINTLVRGAMNEAAASLLSEYPEDFTAQTLQEHIEDLLYRFGNLALGDTIFRVGRDLSRKLNRNDRILGAAGLCLKHGLPCNKIMEVFNAALDFRAVDEWGAMYASDTEFLKKTAVFSIDESGSSSLIFSLLGLKDDDLILEQLIKEKLLLRKKDKTGN
ncbi:MAG: mannitol-1-phosphate 5-dehydrogenase [Spirochaetales bacterium]|uniref:Mannitol-1-phosphate 5-dehydrogenase n=1 Tax=Candidatus Thalassospirochaeta sargassi TaxID=3119039 RepID=A0AAJ1MIW1_9SPIO|nr:mannitol-1-phosphate 5-dehydrogenase [Spirochaetales bacterium]